MQGGWVWPALVLHVGSLRGASADCFGGGGCGCPSGGTLPLHRGDVFAAFFITRARDILLVLHADCGFLRGSLCFA